MSKQEGKIREVSERFEKEPIFRFLKEIQREFPGSDIHLVGGGVRDLLLSRPCKDYDFVVRGVEPKVLQEFLGRIGIVNLVGRVFGVFKFIPAEYHEQFKEQKLEPFDLALPRIEHAYLSGGYRDFDVQSNPNLPIEKDLERRDFTINAIALKIGPSGRGQTSAAGATQGLTSTESGLVDPFGGLEDLEKGLIRAVGKPEDRFYEDYSRMLRALRFACQLGFDIEKQTFAAIKKNIEALVENNTSGEWVVPRETIAKEMLKSFYADPVRAFDLYDQSGAFDVLLPEVIGMKKCPQPSEYHTEGDVFVHTRLALEQLQSEEYCRIFGEDKPSAELVMAIFLHDIGKPPTLKTPKEHGTDRIRFDGHDETGAEMVRAVARRLALENMPDGTPLHVSADKLGWLIKNHLLLLHGDPKKMRANTIEKYFFNPLQPGDELIRLSFCDGMATVPKDGEPDMTNFHRMMERIEEVGKLARDRKVLPPPFLNGEEIMEILDIKPGKQVGEVIRALREEQLEGRVMNKEEAIRFVKQPPDTIK